MSTTYPSAPVPKIQVNYAVGRDMIKDGDLISFFTSHEETWLHRFTTIPIYFFVGSKIYHSGIALWMTTSFGDRRLMLCESVGVGQRLVNMSHFGEHKMEVHSKPDNLDGKKIVEFMLDTIGTGYAFGDLFKIGASEFFGNKPPATTSKTGVVCSEQAARAWQAGGFQFDSTAVSPGKLRNVLSSKGVPPSFMINPDSGN